MTAMLYFILLFFRSIVIFIVFTFGITLVQSKRRSRERKGWKARLPLSVITGGASGIGEYTAKVFTQNGAKVIIADIQDDLGHSVCKELGPSVASYIHCNVTNEAHVKNAVDSTMTQYGKLDIMFNNAGIAACYPKPILDNTQSEFEEVIKVNLVGPFLGIKHAARVMIPAQKASIITTASNAVDSTTAQHGKLDIMVNNAGIVHFLNPNILDVTQSDFEEVVKVNLVGPFLGTKHAARVMVPAQQGSIITTASTCSIIGGAATHAYTSSKHGVLGLTRNTAVELGKYGIRVNCVSPHLVATPLTRKANVDDETIAKAYSSLKGACCKKEDVANAALFSCK